MQYKLVGPLAQRKGGVLQAISHQDLTTDAGLVSQLLQAEESLSVNYEPDN